MTTARADRRGAGRLTPDRLSAEVSARIRPGHLARVRNLSTTGVSIETTRRLSPGSVVELTVVVGAEVHATRARVVRCHIVGLGATEVVFAGGLEMEKQLPVPATVDDL